MASGGSSLSKKINKPFLSFEIKVRNYPFDMLLKKYKKSNAAIIKIDIEEGAFKMLYSGKWDATSQLLNEEERIKNTVNRLPYLNNFKSNI